MREFTTGREMKEHYRGVIKRLRAGRPKKPLFYLGKVHKGEVWKVDGRLGKMTIRINEDVEFRRDVFFDAEIIEGRAQFISAENRLAQRLSDYGMPGTVMAFRTSLTRLVEHVE